MILGHGGHVFVRFAGRLNFVTRAAVGRLLASVWQGTDLGPSLSALWPWAMLNPEIVAATGKNTPDGTDSIRAGARPLFCRVQRRRAVAAATGSDDGQTVIRAWRWSNKDAFECFIDRDFPDLRAAMVGPEAPDESGPGRA